MPSNQQIIDAVGLLRHSKIDETDKKTIQIIFRKIEQHLLSTSELAVDRFSLEHIADQSTLNFWTPKIGNLIPLDETVNNNIKSGLSFSEKKIRYKKSALKIVAEFIRLNKQDTWTEVNCDKWAARIGELLVEATKLRQI